MECLGWVPVLFLVRVAAAGFWYHCWCWNVEQPTGVGNASHDLAVVSLCTVCTPPTRRLEYDCVSSQHVKHVAATLRSFQAGIPCGSRFRASVLATILGCRPPPSNPPPLSLFLIDPDSLSLSPLTDSLGLTFHPPLSHHSQGPLSPRPSVSVFLSP